MRRSIDLHWQLVVLMGCHSGEPLGFFTAGDRAAPDAASAPAAPSTSWPAPDASSSATQTRPTPPIAPRGMPNGRDIANGPVAPSNPPDAAPPAVDVTVVDASPPGRAQCEGWDACADAGVCAAPTDCALDACDAGRSGSACSPLGAACASNAECASGFCVEGSCCDSACDGDCQKCGAGGLCNVSPALDFNCEAVVCPLDTTCRSYYEPPLNRCAEVGRCVGEEGCVAHDAEAYVVCGDGLVCDGNGECVPGDGSVPIVPTPVSPSSKCSSVGIADDSRYQYCYDLAGNVMARGFASAEGYLELFVPPGLHGSNSSSIFGFDENGNELCAILPAQGRGYFTVRRASCVGIVTFTFYGRD